MSWLSSTAYQSWSIQLNDYPNKGDEYQQITHILKYASLAPSTFNSQPWHCTIKNQRVEVWLDANRMPKISDKDGRFGVISVGCFIENLVIAAEHFGWEVAVEAEDSLLASSHKIASVRLLPKDPNKHPQRNHLELMRAMILRATNRSFSQPFNLESAEIKALKALAGPDQSIQVLDASYTLDLTRISEKADMRIWSNIDFKREHVQWVRHNLTRRPDGMPAFGVGVGLIPSFFAKPFILNPKFALFQAKKNIASLQNTSYYLVITSKEGKAEWSNVGRLFQRIGLDLASRGLSLAPMGQFIEDTIARKELHSIIKSEYAPQLFMRLNKPSISVKHSPRLAVDAIIASHNQPG